MRERKGILGIEVGGSKNVQCRIRLRKLKVATGGRKFRKGGEETGEAEVIIPLPSSDKKKSQKTNKERVFMKEES